MSIDDRDVLNKILNYEAEFDKFVEESNNQGDKEATEKLRQEYKIRQARTLDLMKFLEIPCTQGRVWERIPPTVSAFDLYDILMDEEKLRVLVCKLRNKAFW